MVLPDGGPDPAWLGDILTRNGWIDAGVAEISATELGVGVGLLGSVRRIRVQYDHPVAAAGLRNPASVVVKLPSDNPANRAIAEHFGYHERELGVYRHLLPRPGVATPTCYGTDETADGLPVLVLEDLGHHRHGDQVAGATDGEAFAAATLLGSIHAAFWDDPRLRTPALAARSDRPPSSPAYGELFALTWPTFLRHHAGELDAQHLATASQAIDHFSPGLLTVRPRRRHARPRRLPPRQPALRRNGRRDRARLAARRLGPGPVRPGLLRGGQRRDRRSAPDRGPPRRHLPRGARRGGRAQLPPLRMLGRLPPRSCPEPSQPHHRGRRRRPGQRSRRGPARGQRAPRPRRRPRSLVLSADAEVSRGRRGSPVRGRRQSPARGSRRP